MTVSSKHLALFIPSLRGGGAERVTLQIAEGFVQRGVEVDLILAQAQGSYLNKIPEGVVLRDLKVGRVLMGLPRLVRYFRAFQPDVMLSFMTHANLIALWARRLAGVKTRLVISERNMMSLGNKGAVQLKYRLLPRLARGFYSWADDIIAVSSGVADDVADITHMQRERIRTIYNPVVTPRLTALADEPLEHPWFASDDVPVLLGVGRLEPQKDFGTLLKAFAQLRKQRELRLLLLGEGGQRKTLEAMASKLGIASDVMMPGFVDNPFYFMRRASVLVVSSAWEGLPGVLIQAMACGCPVVSTDCPSGPREILEDGRYGRLVPVGGVDVLAEAIAKTLDHSVPTEQLVKRAQDFSQDIILEQYAEVLFGSK